MRRTNSGSRCIGSSRPSSVRFGSTFETTARAAIDSPVGSVTPEAAPSAASIRATLDAGSNLDAGLPRRRRQRVGQRAGSADDEPAARDRVPLARAEQQQHRRRCRPTTARGTSRARRRPRSSRAAARSRTIRRPDRRPPSASSAAAGRRRPCRARGTSGRSSAARSGRRRRGRRWRAAAMRATRAQHAADPREAAQEARVLLGILRRERADLLRRARRVVPQDERAAVERRRAGVDGGPDDPQPVPHQPEPPHDAPDRSPPRAPASGRGIPARSRPCARIRRRDRSARGRASSGRALARSVAAMRPLWPPPMTMTSSESSTTISHVASIDRAQRHGDGVRLHRSRVDGDGRHECLADTDSRDRRPLRGCRVLASRSVRRFSVSLCSVAILSMLLRDTRSWRIASARGSAARSCVPARP